MDSETPTAEPETLSIGINSVILLEVTRQTIKIAITIHEKKDHTEMALIDSGAGGNFIDSKTVQTLQLPTTLLQRTIKVRNVDGTSNHNGQITHRTILEATIAGKRQTLSLLITGLGSQKLILGLPWLIKENPDINWLDGTLEWRKPSPYVINDTLEWRKPPPYVIEDNDGKEGGNFTDFYPNTRDFIINTVETYQEPDELDVPSCLDILKIKIADHFDQIFRKKKTDVTPEKLIPKIYHQYLKLFNKKASERYPKPRIYDHEIHLKPKFKPIKQPPYSLNPKQMDITKEFIDENLKKGYIVHSKSEMASPLFFVGKKDGSLRPCQDY